jgi:serine/threonine-protein kinase
MFLASVLLYATLMWLVYVALEPFVRRRWPHMLVAWTRLLGGEWRDPAVGRDVLVGCTAAACVHAAMHAQVSLGYGIPIGGGIDVTLLGNTAKTLGAIFDMTSYGLFAGLTLLFFLFFLRVVLRNDWAAATLLVIVLSVYGQILDALNFFAGAAILLAAVIVVFAVVSVFVVMRFGLLAAVAMYVAAGLLDVFPITLNTSAWYSGMGYVGLTMFAGLLLYGFRTSLGGRRVFEFADV